MDEKNLSKYKYIYRIYESGDKVLHCEKYPIIYINSEVVYYKTKRSNARLHFVDRHRVLEDFAKYTITKNWYGSYTSCFDKHFITTESKIKEIYEDLLRQKDVKIQDINREEKKNDFERKRTALEKAKREYELALKEFEMMKSQTN